MVVVTAAAVVHAAGSISKYYTVYAAAAAAEQRHKLRYDTYDDDDVLVHTYVICISVYSLKVEVWGPPAEQPNRFNLTFTLE